MTRKTPLHIWLIAIACWGFSFLTITLLWLSSAGRGSAAEDSGSGGLLFVTGFLLAPGLMGYWLVDGRRWVRWLFPLLVVGGVLAVLVAAASPGLGPDAEEGDRIGLMFPMLFLVAAIGASVAVFWHFRHRDEP